MHVGLAPVFLCCLDLPHRLAKQFEPFGRSTRVPKGAREHGEKKGNNRDSPSGAEVDQGFLEEFQAFFHASRLRQAPSANAERNCRPIWESLLGAESRQFVGTLQQNRKVGSGVYVAYQRNAEQACQRMGMRTLACLYERLVTPQA